MDQSLSKQTGAIAMQTEATTLNTLTSLQRPLLATKFFVPATLRSLIACPHLSALLEESLKHSLTLVSVPAGFGKTTLLTT
jgi:ATP/maltotriose-dependent transcriptional regulator MalT